MQEIASPLPLPNQPLSTPRYFTPYPPPPPPPHPTPFHLFHFRRLFRASSEQKLLVNPPDHKNKVNGEWGCLEGWLLRCSKALEECKRNRTEVFIEEKTCWSVRRVTSHVRIVAWSAKGQGDIVETDSLSVSYARMWDSMRDSHRTGPGNLLPLVLPFASILNR
ncbi:hypothetical protein M0804_000646 [Polistes exclamans]|nr:hypothetical protein M0804_000646 [Polistes exclamans]